MTHKGGILTQEEYEDDQHGGGVPTQNRHDENTGRHIRKINGNKHHLTRITPNMKISLNCYKTTPRVLASPEVFRMPGKGISMFVLASSDYSLVPP